jgi:hypothetical protein
MRSQAAGAMLKQIDAIGNDLLAGSAAAHAAHSQMTIASS